VPSGGVVLTQDGDQLKDKDSKVIVGVVRHYYCFVWQNVYQKVIKRQDNLDR